MSFLLKSKRVGWAIVAALVTMMALVSYFSGKRYLAAVRAVEHTLAVQSSIHSTLTLLVDAETGHRGYLVTGDPKFMDPLVGAKHDLPDRFTALDALIAEDSAQLSRLHTVRRLSGEKLAFIEETGALRRRGDSEQAASRVRSGRGKALMDSIRAQCRAMLEHEERELAARKVEAEQAERVAVVGIGAGSTLMILLALVSLLTVNRDVEELRRTAEELAKSEEHYRLLTDQGTDLVRLLSLDGRVTYVSPSVERLLGYTSPEYLALSPLSLMHPLRSGRRKATTSRRSQRQARWRRFDLPLAP